MQKLSMAPKTQPAVQKLKAAFLSPNMFTKTAIKKGPAPLPTSSVVLRNAKAVPLCCGIVTFCRMALTLGPVMLARNPDSVAKKSGIKIFDSVEIPLSRTKRGRQPALADSKDFTY